MGLRLRLVPRGAHGMGRQLLANAQRPGRHESDHRVDCPQQQEPVAH